MEPFYMGDEVVLLARGPLQGQVGEITAVRRGADAPYGVHVGAVQQFVRTDQLSLTKGGTARQAAELAAQNADE
jgi:hypothetical protein